MDKMFHALRPGGRLFSLFSPIWSAHDGHHLPQIQDLAGNQYHFGNSPIPPWGHLLMRPMELFDHLIGVGCDKAFAREVVYYVYSSNHLNRFFLEDFLQIVRRSDFKVVEVTPVFPRPVPPAIQARLEQLHPGRSDFSHNGVLLVLERPEP
jgi:hypothetical protein